MRVETSNLRTEDVTRLIFKLKTGEGPTKTDSLSPSLYHQKGRHCSERQRGNGSEGPITLLRLLHRISGILGQIQKFQGF